MKNPNQMENKKTTTSSVSTMRKKNNPDETQAHGIEMTNYKVLKPETTAKIEKEKVEKAKIKKAAQQGCMIAQYQQGEIDQTDAMYDLSLFSLPYNELSKRSSSEDQLAYLISKEGEMAFNYINCGDAWRIDIIGRLNRKLPIGPDLLRMRKYIRLWSPWIFLPAFNWFIQSAAQGYAPAVKKLEEKHYKDLIQMHKKNSKRFITVYSTVPTASKKLPPLRMNIHTLRMNIHTQAMGQTNTNNDDGNTLNTDNRAVFQ